VHGGREAIATGRTVTSWEHKGEWWLPGRENEKVPGTLRHDADEGTSLDLLGALSPSQSGGHRLASVTGADVPRRSGTYPRIHGQVGGSAYTLDDCFRSQLRRSWPGEFMNEKIVVNKIYKGPWFDVDEPVQATRILVAMRHLAYWLGKTGLEQVDGSMIAGQDLDAPRRPWSTQVACELDAETVALARGTTVSFSQTLRSAGDGVRELHLEQDFVLGIEVLSPTSIEDLLEQVSDIRDLVSIGTQRTACYERITLQSPDLVRSIGDREVPEPVEFFANWLDRGTRSDKANVHLHEMLFTFEGLGGMDGVRRWAQVAAVHRTALVRVMATKYVGQMYVSDTLLNRVAALEAVDRTRYKDRLSLRKRLERCADLAGRPFELLVGDPDSWTKKIVRQRDIVAHHLGRLPDGSEHLFLADSAYWLFVMCMLRLADVPSAVFARIEKDRHIEWLAPRIQAVL